MAGRTRTHCIFQLRAGSIKQDRHVEFLKELRAHVNGTLLTICNGLQTHQQPGPDLAP